MWYWLDDEADHEYTNDVEFAVPQVSIPSILEALHQTGAEVSQLAIGGVNARISKQGVRTDFIDRSSEEWGNLQLLYLDAIRAAEAQDDRFEGIPVAPPEHLAAMKLAAGTDKDERDAIRLLAKVKDLDVEATRDLVRKFLGPRTPRQTRRVPPPRRPPTGPAGLQSELLRRPTPAFTLTVGQQLRPTGQRCRPTGQRRRPMGPNQAEVGRRLRPMGPQRRPMGPNRARVGRRLRAVGP